MQKHTRYFILMSFLLGLIACGGGSSSNTNSNPPPNVGGGPTWTQGVFAASSSFKDQCLNPRSGVDINGNVFPDRQGSLDEEKFWLRSWSDETYLWYNEIPDQDPAPFETAVSYFDELITPERTASGSAKDNFHFYQDTAEYQQQVSTGSSAGYGMQISLIRTSPPRQAIVAYTEPNTPATNNSITRGAEILEIDGVDLINGSTQAEVDILNAGLFPASAGEDHVFLIRDLNSTETRTVTLSSEVITSSPVQNTKVISTNTGNVGYLTFNTFGTRIAEEQLFDAFNTLANQNINDLVVDLRYNGGGFLYISSQLAYMIAGSTNTAGKIYYENVFNDKNPTTNPVTGETLEPTPFYNTGSSQINGQALPSLNLNRVFILSTNRTCSASEALINGLRGADVEVILIGGTTCGKPYGFYPTDNCGTTYFTIQFQGENNKGFGAYPDGFIPSLIDTAQSVNVKGCNVSDDFNHLLGDENEAMLNTALEYRSLGNNCPVNQATSSKLANSFVNNINTDDPLDLLSDSRVRNRLLLEQLTILGTIDELNNNR